MASIEVLKDRVAVENFIPEETTPGGIILPDSVKKEEFRGTVVAVGPEATVKVGDKIAYGRYAGHVLEWGGKDYRIFRDDEILAVLHDA